MADDNANLDRPEDPWPDLDIRDEDLRAMEEDAAALLASLQADPPPIPDFDEDALRLLDSLQVDPFPEDALRLMEEDLAALQALTVWTDEELQALMSWPTDEELQAFLMSWEPPDLDQTTDALQEDEEGEQ